MTGLERKNYPHLSHCLDRMNMLEKVFNVEKVDCGFAVTRNGINIFRGTEREVAAWMEGFVSGFCFSKKKM